MCETGDRFARLPVARRHGCESERGYWDGYNGIRRDGTCAAYRAGYRLGRADGRRALWREMRALVRWVFRRQC